MIRLWRLGIPLVVLLAGGGTVRAQDDTLAADPRAQADQIAEQARQFFDSHDYRAAGIWFDQASRLYERLERSPDGQLDPIVHDLVLKMLLRAATSYTQANLLVEALDRFTEARARFPAEIDADPVRREAVAAAIARLQPLIGSLRLTGLPADAEVRIEGRLDRGAARAPVRLAGGDHAIEVRAPGHRRFATEVTVAGGRETSFAVKMEPLRTPARVRLEGSAGGARVAVDGRPLGDAPVELALPPGGHRYRISAEGYLPVDGDFTVGAGERLVVRATLVPRRAPWGLRVSPSVLGAFPLRTDTPFERWSAGIGLALFHDYLRLRNLRAGFLVETFARELNHVGAGMLASWCPDRTSWRHGAVALCPGLTVGRQFGGRVVTPITTWKGGGLAFARAGAALELRRGAQLARLSAAGELSTYATGSGTVLMLWSTVIELAVGLDL